MPAQEHRRQPRRRHPPHRPRPPARRRRARRRVRPLQPAARRPARRRRRRLAPARPGTDVAVMLGLAHTLVDRGPARPRLPRPLLRRLRPLRALPPRPRRRRSRRPPEWAAAISGIPAETIRALARRMAGAPHAGQRQLVAAARRPRRAAALDGRRRWRRMLGQIGLPGGGFGFGYGSMAYIGEGAAPLPASPSSPRARTPSTPFIPVARIADMLLHPGEPFDYDGQRPHLPRHQARLLVRRQPLPPPPGPRPPPPRPGPARDVVVHDPFWTADGPPRRHRAPRDRHAGAQRHRRPPQRPLPDRDAPGRRALRPGPQRLRDLRRPRRARSASRDAFTEGRDEPDWLRHLYERLAAARRRRRRRRPRLRRRSGRPATSSCPLRRRRPRPLRRLPRRPGRPPRCGRRAAGSSSSRRRSPASATTTAPATPPGWSRPSGSARRGAARYPLHLIANNPRTRLHSQLDVGAYSQASKVQGREPIRIHPDDAAARGIADGDVVRVFNDRGSCLAGAVLSDDVRPGVVQLSTGAWYDPLDPADPDALCVHGNPNVLTRDAGTSRLAQGCAGQHALVQVERWTGPLPPIRAYDPPSTVERDVPTRNPA